MIADATTASSAVEIAATPDGASPTPASASFERLQRLLQRLGGRRAVAAVLVFAAVRVQVGRGRVGTVEPRTTAD